MIFEEPPVIHGTRSEDAMYIRSFTFARDVPIRIDYSAKYMDLAHGAVAGILSGLTSLNCSELTLKKVHYRNGISGLDKLITLLVTEWLTDIRQNQIPRILGGVGPMHSFLQLVQGFKDLFMMVINLVVYCSYTFTSGWGKSQPPLFTPEKLDMFHPMYCLQQVFWLNIRPSTKRYKQFLYLLYDLS